MERTYGRRIVVGAAACLFLGLGGVGCSETGGGFDLARLIQPPTPSPGPVPDSPSAALRLLEWSYNNRSLTEYGELLSDDFRWLCGPTDSAGADWRGTMWTREDELRFARHLFSGGSPDQAAASSINLRFDTGFFILPDPQYAYFPEIRRAGTSGAGRTRRGRPMGRSAPTVRARSRQGSGGRSRWTLNRHVMRPGAR